MNEFAIYKFLFPFRSRQNKELRRQRNRVTVDTFIEAVGGSARRREIAELLWVKLRERAFVEDFKPSIHDDLYKIYGFDAEILADELISEMMDTLDVLTEGIDFTGFSFDAIKTPADIVDFIEKVDTLRHRPVCTKFVLSGR